MSNDTDTPSRTPAASHEPQQGRAAFSSRGLRAKKNFGQCFLADENIARIIAAEATTPAEGTVLEIGAGTGALTKPLLQRASRVIAIERDRDLVPLLADVLAEHVDAGSLQIVEADAAAISWPDLLHESPRPHVVAGNVPYQITGLLIERACLWAKHFDRVVLMVQREVAQRMGANPGPKTYGALSVFVQASFEVTRTVPVPASCFVPRPSVDSAVVVLTPRPNDVSEDALEVLPVVVKAAFSKRRKTLRNAWTGVAGLDRDQWNSVADLAGVNLSHRAERVSPTQFTRVAAAVANLTERVGDTTVR